MARKKPDSDPPANEVSRPDRRSDGPESTRETGATKPARRKVAHLSGSSDVDFNQRIEEIETSLLQQFEDYCQVWQAHCASAEDRGLALQSLRRLVDPARVESLIARQLPGGELSRTALQAIFRELVSGVRATVQATRVAFLGPEHSYSHLAALSHFGTSVELVPVRTIASVFEEVQAGHVHTGVVPIENSTDGRIVDTLEMFTRCNVRICGEIPFRIHHNLLGNGERTQVREVCSKPQAMSQCREWLANHLPDAVLTPVSSTTAAAKRAGDDPQVAAIASYQAAVEYGLHVLAKNIEDNPHNVTRFAIIGLESNAPTREDKTSLMFELTHEPGALADAMSVFKRNRLNLTWIESFPKPSSPNEYLFFVELVGHQADLRVRRALASLERKIVLLRVLGSYPIVKLSLEE